MGNAWHQAVSAVVIAGGRAKRLGGRDKGLVPLGGKPLVCHLLRLIEGRVAALALNIRRDSLAAYEAAVGSRTWLFDRGTGLIGPLGGVLAGLEWIADRHAAGLAGGDWLLTLPVDMPFLPADLPARLWQAVERAREENASPPSAVVAEAGGRWHHLCCLWQRGVGRALGRLVHERGIRRVGDALAALDARPVSFSDASAFLNINTPADLARAEETIQAREQAP